MIDILIPTYNRAEHVRANLEHLERMATTEQVADRFRILISDNASQDGTAQVVRTFQEGSRLRIELHVQETNIGLEANTLFLIGQATAEFIMFLGDDDLLPEGYLSYVVRNMGAQGYGAIIPGCIGVLPDGTILQTRPDRRRRSRKAGLLGLFDYLHYGHQLSGLTIYREGLYQAYLAYPEYRNIYLFIFLLGYAMQRHPSIYNPDFQVRVAHGNPKDWSYDASNLLVDLHYNYHLLYPRNPLLRVLLFSRLIMAQSWRIGSNLAACRRSFRHLMATPTLETPVKAALPLLTAIVILKFSIRKLIP